MGRLWSCFGPRYRQVDRTVRRGGFGKIRRCHDSVTGSDVAIKTIRFQTKKDGLPSSVLREISVLKELEHENVVRLLDVMCTPNYINLSLEWLENDLGVLIRQGTLDTPQIKIANFGKRHNVRISAVAFLQSFLVQILQGVCYCHSQKVLHRDLKPSNLLLDLRTNKLKLADFGLARTFDGAPAEYSTDVVTTAYKAPELLLEMRQSTTAVDIWSVGCIFAEMVNGTPLFGGTIELYVLRKIISVLGVPSETEWPGVTAACRKSCVMNTLPSGPLPDLADLVPFLEPEGVDLLSKMLSFIPANRITAHKALEHPYLKNS